MRRVTRNLGSASALLAAAAFSGLILGSSGHASASSTSSAFNSSARQATKAGVRAHYLDGGAKHDCKGENDCKGQGGCKASDQGCKGKNTCKGKGGCNTNTGALY